MERNRRYRRRHPEAISSRKLRDNYGITLADYNRLLAQQDGRCAVCRRTPENAYRSKRVKALSVDHDHKTGAIRGLLCGPCNTAIGMMGESPEQLAAASDYLYRAIAQERSAS